MELFHLTRQYFGTMGIYDGDSLNWRSLLFLVATFKLSITTGAFIVLSKAKNSAENAFAFYQTINALGAMFAISICIWKKRNIFELIYSFESFIEKRSQTPISKIKYDKLKGKIEKTSKLFHIILIEITFSACNVTPLVISLINYYVLNLNDESFFLQGPTIIPFKWAPPFGYIFVWINEAVSIFCVLCIVVPLITYGIGLCWLVNFFIKDIRHDLTKLNRIGKEASKNARELKVRFCKIIQLYSEAKGFMSEMNSIGEFLILILFVYTLLSISTSLFAAVSQISQTNGEVVELIPAVFSMVWSFAIILGVCEFGERLTRQFDEFDEKLCKCKWYLLPLELQRMLVIVMSNAQQPSFILGYGNIQCTRDSFKQTVHAAFSYFMMLRRVNG